MNIIKQYYPSVIGLVIVGFVVVTVGMLVLSIIFNSIASLSMVVSR